MNSIVYVTGNHSKFTTAQQFLQVFKINLLQEKLNIAEIQSESIEEISQDKAKKAFEILKKPLFVNDSGWYIDALNGFPGPYMAYINKWFTIEDFLRLMNGQQNRKITLQQVVTFIDHNQCKTFSHSSPGQILTEARGKGYSVIDSAVSLSDSGLSLAEQKDKREYQFDFEKKLWHEVGEWIVNYE